MPLPNTDANRTLRDTSCSKKTTGLSTSISIVYAIIIPMCFAKLNHCTTDEDLEAISRVRLSILIPVTRWPADDEGKKKRKEQEDIHLVHSFQERRL